MQRYSVFCATGPAEDEIHIVFDCPAYRAIRQRSRFTNIFGAQPPHCLPCLLYMIPKSYLGFEGTYRRNTLVAAQTGHIL